MKAPTHRQKLKPAEIALFLLPVILLAGFLIRARQQKAADRFAMLNGPLPGGIGSLHSTSFNALAYSPDGSVLATGTMLGRLQWWDARNGTLTKILNLAGNKRDWTTQVAFSPDGNFFAANLRHVVLLYDGHSGKYLRALHGPQSTFSGLAFSPDSKTLAAGCSDPVDFTGRKSNVHGSIALWQVSSGALKTLQSKTVMSVTAVDFSPNGQDIVALGGKRRSSGPPFMVHFYAVQLWDSKKAVLKWEASKSAAFRDVHFSPDGRRIATGGNAPLLFNAINGALALKSTKLSTMGPTQLEYIDGGNLILGASDFRPMVLWNSSDGDLVLPELNERGAFGYLIRKFAVSRDRTRLAYIDGDLGLQAWDISPIHGSVSDSPNPLSLPKRLWTVPAAPHHKFNLSGGSIGKAKPGGLTPAPK